MALVGVYIVNSFLRCDRQTDRQTDYIAIQYIAIGYIEYVAFTTSSMLAIRLTSLL